MPLGFLPRLRLGILLDLERRSWRYQPWSSMTAPRGRVRTDSGNVSAMGLFPHLLGKRTDDRALSQQSISLAEVPEAFRASAPPRFGPVSEPHSPTAPCAV